MKNSPKRGTPDFLLLFLTFFLVCFGIAFVFSASMALGPGITIRQVVSAVIGTVSLLFFMNIDYRKLQKWIVPVFLALLALLLITPIIGAELNNAKSWIKIGSFSLQPTEFAKLGVVIYLANLISKKADWIGDFKKGFIPPVAIISFVSALIMLQPDFGSTAILFVCAMIIIFVAGAKFRHFLVLGTAAGCFGAVVMAIKLLISGGGKGGDYRVSRITTFLDPKSDPTGSGYQLIQSLYALGHGRITGAGFGQGVQKLHYLPLPYNDFIFSIIGEELGFIGATIFLLVYLAFLWRCLIVALRSKEKFGMLTGVGIFALMGIQASINIGGVTNTIPMTGVTLPLISYGGSSIIVTLTGLGILLSISRDRTKPEKQPKQAEAKHSGRWTVSR